MENEAKRDFGKIIILNGAPRSGKSSLVKLIQESFDGIWINLGVDNYMRMLPEKVMPGIGLRPGGERPDLEPILREMYFALYESIAAHSRRGFNVVADTGHHEFYSIDMNLFEDCMKILEGLPVYKIGVYCGLDEILRRREATAYPARGQDGAVLPPVLRWQDSVHKGKTYDLTVDTTATPAAECVKQIAALIGEA